MSKAKRHNIELIPFQLKQLPLLKDYYLPKDQLHYTRSPHSAIEASKGDMHQYPVTIKYGDLAVGFFILHDWEGVKRYSKNKHALLLRSYSIDSSYQGNGLAKQSIEMLPAFVKANFLRINELILAVNWQNTPAQHVYKRCGFQDKGVRIMGRKGEQFVLQKDI